MLKKISATQEEAEEIIKLIKRTFYKSIVISCILAILIIAAPASAEQGKFYRTFFQSGDIPSIDQALVGDQIGIQLVDELTVGPSKIGRASCRERV